MQEKFGGVKMELGLIVVIQQQELIREILLQQEEIYLYGLVGIMEVEHLY